MSHRAALGRFGESVAAAFLQRRGADIVARNVTVGRGEIDLVARLGDERVAVEVKTRWEGSGAGRDEDPLWNFDSRKSARVRSLARELQPPAWRVDFISVAIDERGARVRWLPRAG